MEEMRQIDKILEFAQTLTTRGLCLLDGGLHPQVNGKKSE
jgi:hypothetical protein